jgi:hypothetical protein
MMFIPHLQDWVLQHTVPPPEYYSNVVTLDVELYNDKGTWLRSSCMSFKGGSLGMGNMIEGIQICSIAGCVTPAEEADCKGLRRRKRGFSDNAFEDYEYDDEDSENSDEGFGDFDDGYVYHDEYLFACNTNLSLTRDILNSDVNSWWMFRTYVFNDSARWAFVNYKDKKIYVYPIPSLGYNWESVWDVLNQREIGGCSSHDSDSDNDTDSETDDEDDVSSEGSSESVD